MKTSIITRWAAAAAVSVASLVAIPAAPASAAPSTGIVINEVYVNGGSSGASFKQKFVELYNPTNASIDIKDWSLQYRAAGTATAFTGIQTFGAFHIEPGKTFLVRGSSNNAGTNPGADITAFDADGTLNSAGGGGTFALSKTATPLTGTGSTLFDSTNLVDLIGYGSSNAPETTAATGNSLVLSYNRTNGVDTDRNNVDFTTATPTPVACGASCVGSSTPVEPAVEKTIAQIQGSGTDSPLAGTNVITTGVVTAVYKTGGFSGAYIQTDGTGGALDLGTHTASDGIFVFSSAFAAGVDKGDLVKVEGAVSEFNGLTEITTGAGKFSKLAGPASGVTAATVTFPLATAQKESLEGMLLAPQGDYTITNNFATNNFAEIGLAPGDKPFDTPTNVVAPGAPAIALQAKNNADLVTLDDGASLNFLSAANQGTPLPWLTPTNQVRAGQKVTFDDPVVLDFRNSLWKLQPTEQLLAGADEPVDFGPGTRTAAPKDVGGDVKIGTFNVLNYFTQTAEAYDAGPGACTFYNDREGNHITANSCGNPSTSTGNGPRGAANDANLARQQAKIVSAINALDADVVSLEEIENSVQFGLPRDTALDTLVAALNATPGNAGKWKAVPSPATLPDLAGQDLIRTAFIYQPAAVETVGESEILDVPAFDNAREPLAQAFKVAGGADSSKFAVIVNHFKSKGSGSGADADQGDGQGASNAARKAQATALVAFADDVATDAGTDKVFLTGDFNAYNKEDPIGIIEAAGFVNVPAAKTDKETYQFAGQVGSLDHVFASEAAYAKVTDADIWNINSYESVAREYSRYNYNVTDFYNESPYRASDHDPEIVGFDAAPTGSTVSATAAGTTHGTAATVEVTVTSDDDTDGDSVTVSDGDTELGSATVSGGKATVTLPADLAAGDYTLDVTYAGNDVVGGSSTTVDLTVAKAASSTTAKAPASVRFGNDVTVTTSVDGPGTTPSGDVTVTEAGTEVGSGTLVDGAAQVTVDGLALGSHQLTVTYAGDGNHSGSTGSVQVTVLKAEADLAATVDPSQYGTSAVLKVTGAPGSSGLVYVANGDDLVGTGSLSNGAASITLSKTIPVGTNDLEVFYAGSAAFDPDSTSVTLTVAKASSVVKKVSVSPTTIVKGSTKPYVTVSVTAPGFVVDGGTVTLKHSGGSWTGTVVDGKVRIRVGSFATASSARTIQAYFNGNALANKSQTSFTVKVVSK